jgi:PAS domain-containing protein
MKTRVLSGPARLSAVLEGLPQAALIVDRRHRVRAANARFRARFPHGRALIGAHCFELLHGRTRPCAESDGPCPLDACLRRAAAPHALHVHAAQDGWRREVTLVEPIHDAAGTVIACLATLRSAR